MSAEPEPPPPTTEDTAQRPDRNPSPPKALLLAAAMFGLSEVLVIPVLILALVVFPARDGLPIIRAEPGLFWAGLAVSILLPAALAAFFYVKLKRALRRVSWTRAPEHALDSSDRTDPGHTS